MGKADLTALSAYSEDEAYFMGPEPTSLDATPCVFWANMFYAWL